MYSREQLIRLRILHVILMIATGIFAYQYLQLDDGLWIPISIIAIIGPFAPGLAISKARMRVIGTICGLAVSLIIWTFIHYFPDSLIFISLLLIYGVGLTAILTYTYFIFFVSIMLTLSFDYMNLFINNEISYVVNRMMCVLIGVIICQFYEFMIFKYFYTNAVNLVESDRLDSLIREINQKLNSINVVNDCNIYLTKISTEIDELKELRLSAISGYSKQDLLIKRIDYYLEQLEELHIKLMKHGGILAQISNY
ncbi:MAG: FUSC family protein [Burkholderiales bacterium]|nr:FUSC family protein [Burkholderiales bacterium]